MWACVPGGRCCAQGTRSEQSSSAVPPVAAQYNYPTLHEEELALGQETKTVKRRFLRVALPKGMLVAWQHIGQRPVSRVATLRLGGLFIATPDPVPVGALVKLVFDVPAGASDREKCEGRPRHGRRLHRYGLRRPRAARSTTEKLGMRSSRLRRAPR
jgi:hypothetical protein